MSNLKAVVFDMDDTLLDFLSLKRSCIDSAVSAMINAGLTVPKAKAVERVYQIYYKEGLESQNVLDKFLLQELGQVDYKMLAAGILAYKKTKGQIAPYPGVTSTLSELMRMGIKLAVLSDAPRLQVWTRLTEAHLQDYFEAVVSFDDTGKRKPHPEPFRLVSSKLGVSPSDTLFVGDWFDRDILGGRSAGMVTAYVKYNNSTMQKQDHELDDFVDYKLEAFRDVLGIVKNHEVAVRVGS